MNKIPTINKKVVLLKIGEIIPYWRNPRTNGKTVEKLKESIQDFGYRKKILVDQNNVIIAGHARYRALLELGFDEVECIKADLDDKTTKEYRIIDNKCSEFAGWDNEKLEYELQEFAETGIQKYFFTEPKYDLPKLESSVPTEETDPNEYKVQLICPHCYDEFVMSLKEILNG